MATRVYKYGLVPIGHPPEIVVGLGGELHRANSLWNTLVALHRESRENCDDARRAALDCPEQGTQKGNTVVNTEYWVSDWSI